MHYVSRGEIMKLNFTRLIDFFLLKKDLYSKLTHKTMWLYIGMAFIGIRDVVFKILEMKSLSTGFDNGIIEISIKTIAILLIAALVIGFVKAISFSYPVFDIIKHFKKKNENNSMSLGMVYSSLLTKVIKVYIIANVLVTPIYLLRYFTAYQADLSGYIILTYISVVLNILGYFWFNGAITRGLCILFKLPISVRGLVFVLAFIWNALLSSAIGYLIGLVIVRL